MSKNFSSIGYVGANKLNVRATPEIKNGNEIDLLNYGEKVETVGLSGKWWEVHYRGEKTGWVSSEHITFKNPALFPLFEKGISNLANDLNTIKVRKYISYEFGLNFDKDSLQCTEYTQFRVKQKLGVDIQWPDKQNRNGGNWAKKLEDKYKILVKPIQYCAMSFGHVGSSNPEYNEIGHVAFVEEVFPDSSIKISEANWPKDGKYNERKLTVADWRDRYKGKFIAFV